MSNDLEPRVRTIESRNRRVELDKKWETSWARRLAIAVLTYIVVFLYLIIVKNSNPILNAFVPAIGFLLSTLLLKRVRDVWQNQQS